MQLEAARLGTLASYQLMTSLLLPRPIAWVGSWDGEKTDNLAPFSYFMGVSSTPPLLALSVARGRGGQLKHTARNILATQEFSVSMVERHQLPEMHRTGSDWPDSEFDVVGLERVAGQHIRAPRVGQARVAMECRLHTALDLNTTHLIIGEVVCFFIDDTLYKEGVVDLQNYDPIARLGGDGYAALGEIFHLPRVRI